MAAAQAVIVRGLHGALAGSDLGSLRLALLCPGCGGTTVLVPEDWEEEFREAALRRFQDR